MSNSYSHRQFGEELCAAATARRGSEAVREVIGPVLLAAPVVGRSGEDEEARAAIMVAQRIDTASGSPDRYVELAADLGALLRLLPPNDALELAEVVAERHRTAAVVGKHVTSIMSRTAFLSFVAEQRWPARVKEKVQALGSAELDRFRVALSEADLPVLCTMLLEDKPWRA